MGDLDQLAMAASLVPGLGDALGVAADARMYATEPESRTLPNVGLSALGVLPGVPAAATVRRVLPDAAGKYIKPGAAGEVRLRNPIPYRGGRISGFTNDSQRVAIGYDKNGELFTVDVDRLDPALFGNSRDSGRTVEHVRQGLEASRK
jgi:hypothetical protein